MKEQLVNTRNRWSQPATGWDTLGWAPLVDPGPLPLQTARSVSRWLWFTLAVGGFLVVTGFAFAHDDPTPGLSLRGLLTVALAALVVALLTIHRRNGPGPLARAMAEYAVVFLLAALVATTGLVDQAPAPGEQASAAIDHRPALVKTIDRTWDRLVGAWDWLAELWRRADHQTAPEPTGEAMARTPAPIPPPSTRRSP
jgi:peptidoglycan/LPS O-acetylase OafA/YrhL